LNGLFVYGCSDVDQLAVSPPDFEERPTRPPSPGAFALKCPDDGSDPRLFDLCVNDAANYFSGSAEAVSASRMPPCTANSTHIVELLEMDVVPAIGTRNKESAHV
jgi:hypothetical protein